MTSVLSLDGITYTVVSTDMMMGIETSHIIMVPSMATVAIKTSHIIVKPPNTLSTGTCTDANN